MLSVRVERSRRTLSGQCKGLGDALLDCPRCALEVRDAAPSCRSGCIACASGHVVYGAAILFCGERARAGDALAEVVTPFILLQSRALIASVSLLPEKLRELQPAPREDRHSRDCPCTEQLCLLALACPFTFWRSRRINILPLSCHPLSLSSSDVPVARQASRALSFSARRPHTASIPSPWSRRLQHSTSLAPASVRAWLARPGAHWRPGANESPRWLACLQASAMSSRSSRKNSVPRSRKLELLLRT